MHGCNAIVAMRIVCYIVWMRLRPSLLIALLTLCFALLQSMAPLLHAHLNGESDVDDGPHMHLSAIHLQKERQTEQVHAFHWHIHANTTPGLILGLTPALIEPERPLPQHHPILLCWLCLSICLMVAMAIAATCLLRLRGWQPPPNRRRSTFYLHLSAPRAPPAH